MRGGIKIGETGVQVLVRGWPYEASFVWAGVGGITMEGFFGFTVEEILEVREAKYSDIKIAS